MLNTGKKSIVDSEWFDSMAFVFIIAVLGGVTYSVFKDDYKIDLLSSHIYEVAALSDNLKRDYGCYPTGADALTDLSVFKNPKFNSCKKTINIQNAYSPSFSEWHNVEIANNQFIFTHVSYEATGDIKIIDDKIVYHFRVSDNERSELLYDRCAKQHGQSAKKFDVKNYKTISDETPCGKDMDGNLLLQLGTLSEHKTPFEPNVRPRQIANEANLSML